MKTPGVNGSDRKSMWAGFPGSQSSPYVIVREGDTGTEWLENWEVGQLVEGKTQETLASSLLAIATILHINKRNTIALRK